MEIKDKLNRTEKTLVLRFAVQDMNVSKVARIEYMHRNTVYFHFDKIKEKTGYDPRCFFELMELVKALGYSQT